MFTQSQLDQNHILQFFVFNHLPDFLQDVSRPFAVLAHEVATNLPRNPERSAALRKLLEAKDAAVRALIANKQEPVTLSQTGDLSLAGNATISESSKPIRSRLNVKFVGAYTRN